MANDKKEDVNMTDAKVEDKTPKNEKKDKKEEEEELVSIK
jgi:hypothetical protein